MLRRIYLTLVFLSLVFFAIFCFSEIKTSYENGRILRELKEQHYSHPNDVLTTEKFLTDEEVLEIETRGFDWSNAIFCISPFIFIVVSRYWIIWIVKGNRPKTLI